MQTAYEQLEAEGYLAGFPGSATRVRFTPRPGPRPALPLTTEPHPEFNFLPGRPDLTSFPFRDWAWAANEARRSTSARALGYTNVAGSPHLRNVIASYLRRVRGADAHPANIVICSGFTQGAALALASLRAAGITTVAVENPGHPDAATLVRRAGLTPTFIPVDGNGIDTKLLGASGARAAVVTPAHQAPTGVVMGPERRRELLDWAERVDGYVIEDDYDSEFRYDRQAVGTLQGLGTDRVISVGSVSKTLAPAIRIGWVLAPLDIAESVAAEKRWSDRGSPTLDQVTLAFLMESGRFDRHLRRMRSAYAARRSTLTGALGRHAPALELAGLSAGLHVCAALPSHVDDAALAAESASRSVGIHALSRYRPPGRPGRPGMVLGFGDIPAAKIEHGVEVLADVLNGVLERQGSLRGQ